MATWDEVNRIAIGIPEVTGSSSSDGLRQWRVRNKLIVWERPLRKSDYEALGDAAPGGAILGVRVPDEGAKQALLSDDGDVYFTTPHFDGYPAILVRLDHIATSELEELIIEAWITRAPKRLVKEWEDRR